MARIEELSIYRQGYFKALVDVFDLIYPANGSAPKPAEILLILREARSNVDLLMEYVGRCEVWYTKHDKARRPIAAEFHPPGESPLRQSTDEEGKCDL